MDLLILCGGKGTRLSSISKGRQKCSMVINGVPFIEQLITLLDNKFNFDTIYLCLGHASSDITSLDIVSNILNTKEIKIIIEKTPLGTGGALKNALALHKLSEEIMICNGDSICNINNLADFYCEVGLTKCCAIMASAIPEKNDRYGSIVINSNRRVIMFEEKSSQNESNIINAGIYIFRMKILQEALKHEKDKQFSLEKRILPRLVKDHNILVAPPTHQFIDIGIPEDFYRASSFLKDYYSDAVK